MRPPLLLSAVAAVLAATAAGPVPAGAQSANLSRNPGAESGPAGNGGVVDIPWWEQQIGPTTVVRYGAAGFPSASTPGPSARGTRFFAGGPADSAHPTRLLTTNVDLWPFYSTISIGQARFSASVWLGGKGAIGDHVALEVIFRNDYGAPIGQPLVLGPVTRQQRANQTRLVRRTTTGAIPIGSRTAHLRLVFTDVDGGRLDAYADNVVFKVL